MNGRAVLPIDKIPSQYNQVKIEQMSVEDMIKHLLKSEASLVADNEELNRKYASLKREIEPFRKLKDAFYKVRFISGIVAVILSVSPNVGVDVTSSKSGGSLISILLIGIFLGIPL